MATPQQLEMKYLQANGILAQVVEHSIPHANKKRDLFGVIDIVALDYDRTIGIQVTSGSNHSARRNKILASAKAYAWVVGSNRELWLVSYSQGVRKLEKILTTSFSLGPK